MERTPEEKRELSERLATRLSRYAAAVVLQCADLPETKEGRHIRDQLLRSGTAPGAHYAEARGARSAKAFTQWTSLALRELRESVHWLETAIFAHFLQDPKVQDAVEEGNQLAAILTASVQTARRNLGDFEDE